MNSDVTTTTKAWAYVHGEMEAGERAAFEQAMAADPEARATVDRIRAVDGRLRRLAPGMKDSDDALIARCVGEWEKEADEKELHRVEPGCPHPGVLRREEMPAPVRFRRPILRFVYAGAALAAAALFLIAVLPRASSGPIRWDEPVFNPIRYRGAGPAPVSSYTARNANACFTRVKREVRDAYPDEKTGWRRFLPWPERAKWRLSFSFSEMANGAFSVTVEACSSAGRYVKEWVRAFDGAREFQSGSHAFGLEIADDLGKIRDAE
jgi:anti-sigma-K factor RskA